MFKKTLNFSFSAKRQLPHFRNSNWSPAHDSTFAVSTSFQAAYKTLLAVSRCFFTTCLPTQTKHGKTCSVQMTSMDTAKTNPLTCSNLRPAICGTPRFFMLLVETLADCLQQLRNSTGLRCDGGPVCSCKCRWSERLSRKKEIQLSRNLACPSAHHTS